MTRSTCYLVHLYIFSHRDDEHALILQYCQTLGGEVSPCSQPQSPAQILQGVEKEERRELERIIQRLEDEQWYGIGCLTKSDVQCLLLIVPHLFSLSLYPRQTFTHTHIHTVT